MDSPRDIFRKIVEPTNYFGSSNNKDKRFNTIHEETLKLLKSLSQRRYTYDSNLIITFVKCLEEDDRLYKDGCQKFVSKLDELYYAHKFPYYRDADINNRTNAIIKCIRTNSDLISRILLDRVYLIKEPSFPPNVSMSLSDGEGQLEISLSDYDFADNDTKNQELLEHIMKAYQSESFSNDTLLDSEMSFHDYLHKIREKINNTNGLDKTCFIKPVNLLDNSFSFVEPLYEKLNACYEDFKSIRPKTYRPKTTTGKEIRDNFLQIKSKWTDIMSGKLDELIKSYLEFYGILNYISGYYDYLEYYINPNLNNKCTYVVPPQISNTTLDGILDTITTIFNGDKKMVAMCFFFFDKEVLPIAKDRLQNNDPYYENICPGYSLESQLLDDAFIKDYNLKFETLNKNSID